MVYDPALTRVRMREPRLDKLVITLRQTTSGRKLLADAAELGFRFDGQNGRQPVILPFGEDTSLWRDLEAFVWQVERQQLTVSHHTEKYIHQFTELSTRTFARTRRIFDELSDVAEGIDQPLA